MTATTPLPRVLTTRQAAEALGISQRVMMYHIGRGNLHGVKLGRDWLIPRSEIERMIGERAGAKPGPKTGRVDYGRPAPSGAEGGAC